MASEVAEKMNELKNLVAEMKRLNTTLREMRDRKKEIEADILTYIEENELPGFKFNEIVVLKTESTVRTRKKKKEKDEEIIKVLEEAGIADAKNVCEKLKNAGKGEEQQVPKLRIKQHIPDLLSK